MNLKQVPLAAALALLLLAQAIPGMAKNDGILIGIVAPYNTFAGDFDGNNYFNSGEEIYLVPKMESAFGYGVTAGSRNGNMDWEFYYAHSKHNFTFAEIRDTAAFDAIGANTRFNANVRGIFKPYVNFGMDFCWLKANQASMTTYGSLRTGSAKYSGLGLFGGVGIGISPVKLFTLYIGGELRWGMFGRVKGVLGESQDLESLSSLSLTLRSGLVFVI
jgi:hypothetical protein